MPKALSLLLITFFLLPFGVKSQTEIDPATGLPVVRTCGTETPADEFEQWFSQRVTEYLQNKSIADVQNVQYTIPIIVHIIHNGTAVGSGANISQAQVNSQLTILNNDFAGTNSDISSLPSVFNSVKAGDTGIRFCLAKVDPDGNLLAEEGIERINRNSRGWSDPNNLSSNNFSSYFNNTIKPNSIWDPTKYLNIWVAGADNSGLLGFASFPAGSGLSGLSGVETANTSGVVVNHKAFGSTGTAASPYNRGRTATHEIGHWLGLRHIWGDGTCATDFCSDTPPAETSNYGCKTHPFNTGGCSGNSSGEMFMNYMDYVNDACMYVFTANQKTRMLTAMANGTYRVGLNNSGACNAPVQLDAAVTAIVSPASGSSSCATTITPVVTLTNFGSSTLNSVRINYNVDNGTNLVFNWTGTLASGAGTSVTLPAVNNLSVGPHTFTASTSLPNNSTDQNTSNDASTISFTVSTPTITALPLSQGFQSTTFVPSGWTLTNSNNDVTWTRTTSAGGFGTSSASARIDHFSGQTSTAGRIDAMLTPTFSFAGLGTATMTFDVAHARYNANNVDSLFIWASTDCGQTWTSFYSKGGTALATAPDKTNAIFVPTSTQWRTETVNLNALANQPQVQFAIRTRSGWGQAIYVDNINITGTTQSVASVAVGITSGNATACAGSPITFSATPTNGGTNPSYQWRVNGNNVGSNSATFTTSTLSNGDVVTCIMTSNQSGVAGSPATSSPVTVTILPIPNTPSPSSNSPVCQGNTLNLTTPAVSGASYSWTGPGGFTSTGQSPSRLNTTPSMSGTYAVTLTVNGCTSAAGSVTVSVNSAPTAPSIASNSPLCSGGNLQLNVATVAGAVYNWTGPQNFQSNNQNPSINGITTAASGTYQLTVTVNGCTSQATSTSIVVNSVPTAPTLSSNSPVCSGNALQLFAAPVTGATYAWSGPNGFSSNLQNPTVSNASSTQQGNYTATVSLNGCTSLPSSPLAVSVVTNASPSLQISSSADNGACEGEEISFSTSGTNSGTSPTFNWFVNNQPVGETGPVFVSTSLNNGDVVNCIMNSSLTCASPVSATSNSLAVTINSAPQTPTITEVNGQLQSSAPAGNQWYLNGQLISGATNSTFAPTVSGNYTVVVTENNCESAASAPYNYITVGLDNLQTQEKDILLYPIPANDFIFINLQQHENEIIKVTLFAIDGRVVSQNQILTKNGFFSLDFSNIANGSYQLRLLTQHRTIATQVIIVHP